MSDPGTEQPLFGEPEDPRTADPSKKQPVEEPGKTEEPDGTPVENPSGG